MRKEIVPSLCAPDENLAVPPSRLAAPDDLEAIDDLVVRWADAWADRFRLNAGDLYQSQEVAPQSNAVLDIMPS